MMNKETTGISGNVVNEKLVSQKKEVNVKTLIDGSIGICTHSELVGKKILILQTVDNEYTFSGYEYNKLLVTNPSPADLDNNSTLDSIVSNQFSNTSSGVVLEASFITPENISYVNLGRAAISVAIRRVSVAGTVYLDKITVSVGSITGNTFTSITNADMTPAILSTSDSFNNVTGQCFINVNNSIPSNSRFAIRLRVYCYVHSAVGEVKINMCRGSADSYIEIE